MFTRYLAIGVVVLAGLFTAYAVFYAFTTPAQQIGPGAMPERNPTPPVKGLYKGKEVTFIHTEALRSTGGRHADPDDET